MKVAFALLIAVAACGVQMSSGASLRASAYIPQLSLHHLPKLSPPTASPTATPSVKIGASYRGIKAGYVKLEANELNSAAKAQFLIWTKEIIEGLSALGPFLSLTQTTKISLSKQYAAKIMILMRKSGNSVLAEAADASTAIQAFAIIEGGKDYELSLAALAYAAQLPDLMNYQAEVIDKIIEMTASVTDIKSAISKSGTV